MSSPEVSVPVLSVIVTVVDGGTVLDHRTQLGGEVEPARVEERIAQSAMAVDRHEDPRCPRSAIEPAVEPSHDTRDALVL